ncbi:uncharacterized protein LOC125208096 [Salvia hispanica]|uniref:uncharacterized protein LOC125208096 n=1 Tax=Salvia hispanica TaxID=49212 RepID=UPI002009812D|nr:uncharacterized protein LOC125208096 [Salvia hispanica]
MCVTCQQPHLSWPSHTQRWNHLESERWDLTNKKEEMREKPTRNVMEDEETNTTQLSSINQQPLLSKRESSLEEEDENATDEEEKLEKERDSSSSKEIIKELKNIQRQNTITHYLLTASILVTLAWQLSEFSLIFKIKQGFSNPLRSIGGAIKGVLSASEQKQTQVIPPTYLPGLKIPDWPGFDTSNEEDEDDND